MRKKSSKLIIKETNELFLTVCSCINAIVILSMIRKLFKNMIKIKIKIGYS